jgi:hypothetical protein
LGMRTSLQASDPEKEDERSPWTSTSLIIVL